MTKNLKRRADDLFSKLIRARGYCQRCLRRPDESGSVTLQCAHVFSRKYTAIRWDERNALCLCVGCHFWAHRNPVEWTMFIEDKIGADTVRSLMVEAREYPGRVHRIDYEQLIVDLRARLRKAAA